MPGHDIIVVGTSAGGVEVLREIVRDLPADLAASLFVVLHIPADVTSHLPSILGRSGRLRVSHAVDGEAIEPGRIYVAPPDNHLLVDPGFVRLVHGPIENRHRPAVDPLFRSAARAYGPRVVGVVLTGALDDGTAGLFAIKRRGGITVVQDPKDALYPSMPRSAMEYVDVDYSVPASELAPLFVTLAAAPAADLEPDRSPDEVEQVAIAVIEMNEDDGNDAVGEPSVFTCPDCHGTLWEMADGGILRFRCRVGHAWSVDSMISGLDDSTERALWAALRALEESTALSRRLATNAQERKSERIASRFEERANESEQNAALVRELLFKRRTATGKPPDEILETHE